ncbi:MAG: zinc-finger domain-containing protein [Minwuia sp.]|nr:zinc-finger domain-containing protein [Minwuia sp.]
MEPAEIVETQEKRVACDGEEGPSGHPRVFLEMGTKDHIDCPYCGRRFVLKEGAGAAAGH